MAEVAITGTADGNTRSRLDLRPRRDFNLLVPFINLLGLISSHGAALICLRNRMPLRRPCRLPGDGEHLTEPQLEVLSILWALVARLLLSFSGTFMAHTSHQTAGRLTCTFSPFPLRLPTDRHCHHVVQCYFYFRFYSNCTRREEFLPIKYLTRFRLTLVPLACR